MLRQTIREEGHGKVETGQVLQEGACDKPDPSAPRLGLKSDEEYGNRQFSMSWWAISEPFEMVTENHKHDFDQFLIFVGGDLTNMVDLAGKSSSP
jgi:hypothetical protein